MMFSFPRLAFPHFQRRVYVFDLDETLFSIRKNTTDTKEHLCAANVIKADLNDYMLHSCFSSEDGLASKVASPYFQFYNAHNPETQFYSSDCYALFKQRMAALMKRIITNGDEIFFLTDSFLEKEDVEKFFKAAYGINSLPLQTQCISTKKTILYNRLVKKERWLIWLHNIKSIPKSDIVFVDNRMNYIRQAIKLRITGIHAKTNACHHEKTVREAKWLSDLEKNVYERTLARALLVLGITVISAAGGAWIGATIGTACADVDAFPDAIIGGLLGAVIGYFAPQWITSCCCCCSSNDFEMAGAGLTRRTSGGFPERKVPALPA